jgi:hypothetical protein
VTPLPSLNGSSSLNREDFASENGHMPGVHKSRLSSSRLSFVP